LAEANILVACFESAKGVAALLLKHLALEQTGAIVAAPPPVDDSLATEPFVGTFFDDFLIWRFS